MELAATLENVDQEAELDDEKLAVELRDAIREIFYDIKILSEDYVYSVKRTVDHRFTVLFCEIPPDVVFSIRAAIDNLIHFYIIDEDLEPKWHGIVDPANFTDGKEDYSTVDNPEWQPDEELSSTVSLTPENRIHALIRNEQRRIRQRGVYSIYEMN